MDRTKVYRCRVKIRNTFKGLSVKESAKALEGILIDLRYAWTFDVDEVYAGEYAMKSDDGLLQSLGGIEWIASGDVEFIEG